MERNTNDFSWYTSQNVGGTPGKENTSAPKKENNTTSTTTSSPIASSTPTSTPSSSLITANQPTPQPIQECAKNNLNAPSHNVIINEVAWAGTASDKTSHEWIELKNMGAQPQPLEGWQLLNKSSTIKIFFGTSTTIAGGSYVLLERSDDETVPNISADVIFNGAIKNTDESLQLFNARCELVDEVVANEGSDHHWAYGVASPDYRTMERTQDFTWHTYMGNVKNNGIFGTPKDENSMPTVVIAQTNNPPEEPPPSQGPIVTSPQDTSSSTPTSTPSQVNARILISEILFNPEGSDSGKEFIELYNAGAEDVDLKDWALKYETAGANPTSLIKLGSSVDDHIIIPTEKHFLIGFSSSNSTAYAFAPDAKRTTALPNTAKTVFLLNKEGMRVDETTYDAVIPEGQSWERVSFDGAVFQAQVSPTPTNSQN